ncbi:MAG: hypothetical protein ACRDHS_02690 [Actinomycetota bacterium]
MQLQRSPATYQAGSAIVAGLIGGLAFIVVVHAGLGVAITRMNPSTWVPQRARGSLLC